MALPEPDRAELGKARGGDPSAFESIVRLYKDWVYALAYRMVYNTHEAGDLSQEIFLRLFRSFDKYDIERPFGPWFFRLATNVCLNACKKRKRIPVTFQTFEDGEKVFDPAGGQPDATDAAQKRDNAEYLRGTIGMLPPPYRLVISLRYLKELSYEEMSDILALPLGTVKNRLFRAREKLKELLAPKGNELVKL